MTRLLLVEDDESLVRTLDLALTAHGFDVRAAAQGERALVLATTFQPAVAIVDLGLPDVDGLAVVRQLRAWSDLPVIVLSARDAQRDKVAALDAGADDYVTKPYSSRELIARIRSVMRRSKSSVVDAIADEDEVLTVGTVSIDSGRHLVKVNGDEVDLPLKEFQLLRELMANAGRVVTRAHLLDQVWGADFFGDQRTLDVHVKRLRSRISPGDVERRLITTIRGVGYRFEDVDDTRMKSREGAGQ